LVAGPGYLSPRWRTASVAAAFVFQNTYVSLLTSQQWSFLDSVVTPRQGAAWFGALTGLGSVAGTLTASLVPLLVPWIGIRGLYLGTAITLLGSLVCADRAYSTAAQHTFDPTAVQETAPPANKSRAPSSETKNSIRQAWALVRRVPTLRALFVEGLVYQIFSTIVNFSAMRALQIAHAHDDARRSSLTGQFYAMLNGVSAIGQFLILPLLMKRLEVKQIWRCIAILPFAATMLHSLVVVRSGSNALGSSSLLSMLAAILFTSQVTDYSVRSVICNVAYQPLDYESRYIGKEFIGVFANRLGRSGMSLFLTALTAMYGWSNHSMADHRWMNLLLTVLLATTCSLWMCSTWWLSRFVPTNAMAQKIVEERQQQ
jgi:ATP/ADP translocase